MQKSGKVFIYLLSMVLLVCSVTAAFSTPYLVNNTVRLNGSEKYEFEIIFQNTDDTSTVMDFEVLSGNEWIEPDTFSVKVPPKTYDMKQSFIISIPENVTVNGNSEKVEYNKVYEIQYAISSGNPGEGGMVSVTSKVKKTVKVVAVKAELATTAGNDENGSNTVLWLIVIAAIAGVGYLYYKDQQKKPEDQPEVKAEVPEIKDNYNEENK
jgi:hypothetical protein